MSFFDQPHYAFTKSQVSLIGMWPEQSTYVRIVRLLTIFSIVLIFCITMLIRLYETWGDINSLMQTVPYLLIGALLSLCAVILNILHFDNVRSHRNVYMGHFLPIRPIADPRLLEFVYNYTAMTLYLALCLSPVILDRLDPLNVTRPKINTFNAEYGVNVDKYYWFILAFEYMVSIVLISSAMAMEALYILWTVHACALFEVVAFNLKLVTDKYTANNEIESTLYNDWNYKKICDCITAHKVAISFADLIETIYSGVVGIVLGFTALMIVFTGVHALISSKHPERLLQLATFTTAQVFSLYLNTIPGQELMDHSRRIQTVVYDLDWQDMSVKAQKLLIPIMIRSNKACCLTAKKVYILSMENFGSIIRTVISYFMIFSQLIE